MTQKNSSYFIKFTKHTPNPYNNSKAKQFQHRIRKHFQHFFLKHVHGSLLQELLRYLSVRNLTEMPPMQATLFKCNFTANLNTERSQLKRIFMHPLNKSKISKRFKEISCATISLSYRPSASVPNRHFKTKSLYLPFLKSQFLKHNRSPSQVGNFPKNILYQETTTLTNRHIKLETTLQFIC